MLSFFQAFSFAPVCREVRRWEGGVITTVLKHAVPQPCTSSLSILILGFVLAVAVGFFFPVNFRSSFSRFLKYQWEPYWNHNKLIPVLQNENKTK